ncbi:MAG TPA: LCP family protein [Acidimicrobiales bacterium]|nr:LCP family protein [Acidimicrobiales bacterium]
MQPPDSAGSSSPPADPGIVDAGIPTAGAAAPSRLRAYRSRRRAKKALRSKLRRRLTRTGTAVALLVVAIVGAVAGYSIYRFGQVTRVPGGKDVTGAAPAGGPENILLIGSTSRCAAAKLAVFAQECAAQVNGVNSDVVMIVRIVPKTHRLTLLSIPRDTFVPDARSGGLYNKIDAALADGPAQLATAITEDFGIPINHFVELNFNTFTNVVNALGGIDLYFPDRLYDASNPPLSIPHAGCIHLNGYQALALVRSRHLYYFTKGQEINYKAIQAATASGAYYTSSSGGSYDGSGDLGRITRVHTFLHVLATTVAKRGIGNPLTDNALIGAIAPDLVVDNKLGDTEMLHLALALHSANLGSAPELTAPIVVDASTYYYKGYNYGDVVFPIEPQDQQTIDQFMGAPPAGLKLQPQKISVSVVDGTNSPSSTAATAAQLHALGYPIVATTATNYVGPVSETSVVYATGHLQDAERVMASLSGTVVMARGTPAGGADVSVIAGSDLAVQSPSRTSATTAAKITRTAPAASAVSAAAVSAAAAVTPTTTNPNIGAPTSASPGASPWDPRACPATKAT